MVIDDFTVAKKIFLNETVNLRRADACYKFTVLDINPGGFILKCIGKDKVSMNTNAFKNNAIYVIPWYYSTQIELIEEN